MALITKHTTFVVGAGASKPYEYPVGTELITEICNLCVNIHNAPGRGLIELLPNLHYNSTDVREFGECLARSATLSIDRFLESQPKWIELGKILIASVLIPCDVERNLLPPAGPILDDDWLRFIFDKMHAEKGEFGKNCVSFVTFNYDRCIEHFFHTALVNRYDLRKEQAATQLKQIPIVHVHGILNNLPWQEPYGPEYGASLSEKSLIRSMNAFKLVCEMSEHEDVLSYAERELAKAERIFCLGFGYESYRLSINIAYQKVPNDGVLNQEYIDLAVPVIRAQLAKAGVRLASYLNLTAVVEKEMRKRSEPTGDKPAQWLLRVYEQPRIIKSEKKDEEGEK